VRPSDERGLTASDLWSYLLGRPWTSSWGQWRHNIQRMNGQASSSSRTNWLLFLLLGCLWGSSFLFIKVGVEAGLHPFTLVALRLLFGTILLAVVVVVTRERLPRERRIYGHMLVVSVISMALPFVLITWAEQRVDSALAAALDAAVPIVVIPLAAVLLPDEPFSRSRLAGVGVGFIGVMLLVGFDPGTASRGDLVGGLAVVAATISYACGAVYARRNLRDVRPTIPAAFQVGFAFIIVAVLALLFEHPLDFTAPRDALVSVLWLGLLGTGVAYLVFFRLLASWGATRASLVAYLLPVVGVTLGVLVLHEQVDGRFLAGTAMVVGGIALVNLRSGARVTLRRSRSAVVDCPEPA